VSDARLAYLRKALGALRTVWIESGAIMEWISETWNYIWSFLVVLTVVVFFHELGHYLIARFNGVRVQTFSIGFGPEIIGWTDRKKTRWKLSLIPLGGYVKFFGDAGAASQPGDDVPEMSEADRAVSFHHKRLHQRAAVVFGGPCANFILAIVLLAILFATVGQQFTAPDVLEVVEGSAAEEAGIAPGDVIREIDGAVIERFEDIVAIVVEAPGRALDVVVERDGALVLLVATPNEVEWEDRFGAVRPIGQLGIRGGRVDFVRHDPGTAIWLGFKQTFVFTGETLKAVGQMISGARSTDELSGPLRIAQISGQVAEQGLPSLIFFMAILSINLGLINLFPVPMLDGGHLMIYGIEAVRGRPLGARSLEMVFRFGLGLIVLLIGFVLWNDFKNLGVVQWVGNLF
jgi:regulator of sigma E protease